MTTREEKAKSERQHQPGEARAGSLLESSLEGAATATTPACDPPRPPLVKPAPSELVATAPTASNAAVAGMAPPCADIEPGRMPAFICSFCRAIFSPQSHLTWAERDLRMVRQWLHCETGRPFFAMGSSLRSGTSARFRKKKHIVAAVSQMEKGVDRSGRNGVLGGGFVWGWVGGLWVGWCWLVVD